MATRFNFDPQALEDLIELPNRCPVAPESRSAAAPVREFLYGLGNKKRVAYRILFRVDGEAINILAIRHSAQDFRPL